MNKPLALNPGDTIRIVSPASALTPADVKEFAWKLDSEGYNVEYSTHCFERNGYLAGTDEQRANDLMEAFADPNVHCVFCSRGGYGSVRLFPYLNLDTIAASGKLFCGFSDITTLHIALNKRGLPTLHAPMMITLNSEREPWVIESVLGQLRGDVATPKTAPAGQMLHGGTATGVVTGGCLALIVDSIATDESIDTEGKIILIEDVDEAPHRVDALFTHLRRTGLLDQAAGIVIGEMTRTDEKIDPKIGGTPWREIIADRLDGLRVPTIIDYPFGHCKNMLSLPLGITAELDANAGTLTYTESLCRA